MTKASSTLRKRIHDAETELFILTTLMKDAMLHGFNDEALDVQMLRTETAFEAVKEAA